MWKWRKHKKPTGQAPMTDLNIRDQQLETEEWAVLGASVIVMFRTVQESKPEHEAKVDLYSMEYAPYYVLCAVAPQDDELTDGDAMKMWTQICR
ncbi:hypothetical protein M5D96_001695 [Drosophila gunungcola]|uniref:Uncharacterized protein n=1 Tax=Drosophila gunungcola TaxID=103775 RepID=A0A9P9YYK5_9MUSC|nr:hypothetical protein M5D96_001695 [Drosophila gunungcola]